MTTIRIPTPLRPYTGGSKEVTAEGPTVGAVLSDLADRFASIRPHLYNGEGALRSYIVVFHNDRDVRDLQGLNTATVAGDRLVIVPSIAGGSAPPGGRTTITFGAPRRTRRASPR